MKSLKTKRKRWAEALAYAALVYLFAAPKRAEAYIDPSTGSYLFQLLVAGLFSSVFFVRSAASKFKSRLRGGREKKVKDADDDEGS